MEESGFQLVKVSPRDREFERAWSHIRHSREKRYRYICFLYLKMFGRDHYMW